MEFSNWMHHNWVEVLGFASALLYLYFSIKQNIWVWPWGIITSSAYFFFYLDVKLYAIAGLNIYYVLISFYGWYNWKHGNSEATSDLPVRKLFPKEFLVLGVIAVAIIFILQFILKHYSDSPVPWSDAIIASFSIVATWMMTKKILENWIVWLLADSFTVIVYLNQEIFLTSLLFMVYASMTLVGFKAWKKTLKLGE